MTFFTDAPGLWGCRARWETHWFQLPWGTRSSPSPIAVTELIPIVLAATVWGSEWRDQSVTCSCDNQAVVPGSAGIPVQPQHRNDAPPPVSLFIEARMQFSLQNVHLPGRREYDRGCPILQQPIVSFYSQAPEADRAPQVLPESLVDALLLFDQDWLSLIWSERFSFTFPKA